MGVTFSGCVCFTFGACACAHVRSLENFTDEQRPSFFFSRNPIFSTKEMKETITHTHSVKHSLAHSGLHLLHTSLTLREAISQTNTCYLALGCARTWVQTHTHTMAGPLLHANTLLFVFRQRLASAALS